MSIRRSLAFSFLEKYASTAINIASTLVLARLLTPAEIGVFSVGAAVVGIMHALRDFGVTSYLIQEREVDREKLRTAFTVTLGLSWLFAGVLLLGSSWAAEFYNEQGVRQIIWVMAMNFALIPFGSPILALMRRDLQFARLAAIQLSSTLVNVGVSILLAALGYGFMSLAWASLAGVVTTSSLAFLSRPHAFLFRPGLHEWRSVLSFGGYASGNALVGDIRQTVPDLFIGRMLSFEAVGLLSRATGLLTVFNKLVFEGVQPVLLPALSEKVRRGEDLRPFYLQAMEYVTALYWPFLAFLALMAHPVIEVLLGDQWLDTAPLLQIMSVSYAISFPAFMTQPLLIALGRIRDVLILNLTLLPLALAAVVLGSLHSLEMIAILAIPASLLGGLINLRLIGRFISLSIREILYATRKSAVVAVASVLVPAGLRLWDSWAAFGPFIGVTFAGLVFSLAWLAAMHLTRHPLRMEIHLALARLPRTALRH